MLRRSACTAVLIGVLLVLALHAWPADNGAAEDLRSLLDAKYRVWRQHLIARASLHPERGDPRYREWMTNPALRSFIGGAEQDAYKP